METQGSTDLCTHLHHHGSSDDVAHGAKVKVILHFEVEVVLVRADGLQELGDVVGVQGAGLRGHAAGQVCVTYVGHPLREPKRGQRGLCVCSPSFPDKPQSQARPRFTTCVFINAYTGSQTNAHSKSSSRRAYFFISKNVQASVFLNRQQNKRSHPSAEMWDLVRRRGSCE